MRSGDKFVGGIGSDIYNSLRNGTRDKNGDGTIKAKLEKSTICVRSTGRFVNVLQG